MADYVSIIAKAVSALAENTAANRQVIYQKARDTIDRKLRAMDPMPAEAAIAAQLQQLEGAIRQVEADELASADVSPTPVIEEALTAPEPVPAAPQAGLTSVLPEAADTPILIDGIGDKTLQHLAAEGVTTVSQIAAMSDGELATLTEKIGIPGFEKTQEWKEQAIALLAGSPPRSKTDQERLRKMLEEAGGPVDEAPVSMAEEPAAMVEETVIPQPVPEATQIAPPPVPQAEPEVLIPEEPAPPVFEAQPQTEMAPQVSATLQQPVDVTPFKDTAGSGQFSTAAVPPIPEPVSQPADIERLPEPQPSPRPIERPISVSAPEPPVGQPDYVSELEGDPALESEPMASRPVPPPRRKSGAGKAIGWLAAVLLVGAAGAGAYYYQDDLKEAGGKAVNAVSALIEDVTGGDAGSGASAPQEQQQAESPASQSEPEKDASRLGNGDSGQASANTEPAPESTTEPSEQTAVRDVTPSEPEQTPVVEADEPVQLVEPADGGDAAASEENPGEPAAGTTESGSETTESGTTQLPGISDSTEQPALLAGEKAFLYEEGFGTNGASRDDGAISWTLANEPPEDGSAPEAVIKGVMEVPARGLQLNLTIKRNVDAALPASHIIELFFTVPPGFSGGNIDQISRFVMKSTEQARGESLVGVPARIDAGFFLIALNNLEQAQQTNLALLETANWIDVPITYLTGRRGLVTLEKGPEGKKVFSEALADWRNR